jgi:transcription elongation factor GreA
MLANAEIGEADVSDGIVKQGLMVHCTLNGRDTEFFLGSHEIFEGTKHQATIDEGDLDVYSTDSPIGKVVLGKKVGDEVTFTTPNGKDIVVKIEKISEFDF